MSAVDSDPFKNIRPYNDDEVENVVAKLLDNREFISALSQFRFPRLCRIAGPLVNWAVRRVLAGQLSSVKTIDDMQRLIAHYMDKMVERTTTQLSYSGLDNIEADKAYLFISNHRDIAMDPAFVNWGMYHNKLKTVRIAIGDNLLKKPYVSDLMRLNKSFIVRRSAKGVREKLAALLELSGYISHSIETNNSIWIAQREGRAKDGNDFTDPAIIKMLCMAKKKQKKPFAESVRELNIVPVSISYEYDPCDSLKARELHERETTGEYQKTQYEDIESIVAGITGFKGDVHVAFGSPMEGEYESADALAAAIDREIIGNYHLHASNLIAAGGEQDVDANKRQTFTERLASVPSEFRERFQSMYANPALNKQKTS